MNKYESGSMDRDDLISALTEDLEPVKRVNPLHGILLIATATFSAFVGAIVLYQWWDGLLTGEASGYFLITNGLLLVLGAASAYGLVTSAMPRIGSRFSAPAWGVAMLTLLPLAAVATLLSGHENHAHSGLNDPVAWMCIRASLIAGTVILAASVLWLRHGAPVSIERSAWLAGLTAGTLGTFAYGITCAIDTLSHVGLWHVAPVAIGAVVGRLIVPPLIRW